LTISPLGVIVKERFSKRIANMSTGTSKEKSVPLEAWTRERLALIQTEVRRKSEEIRRLDAISLIAPFMHEISSNSKVLACNPTQTVGQLLRAATLKIQVDGTHATVVSDDGKTCDLMILYRGIIRKMGEHGIVSVSSEAVREKDELDVDTLSLTVKFRKHMTLGAGKIIGSVAVFRDKSGIVHIEQMREDDLVKVRSVARNKTVWLDWPEEMARIAAVRRGSKFVPLPPAVQRVIEANDNLYDLSLGTGAASAEPAARDGIDPPSQDAGIDVDPDAYGGVSAGADVGGVPAPSTNPAGRRSRGHMSPRDLIKAARDRRPAGAHLAEPTSDDVAAFLDQMTAPPRAADAVDVANPLATNPENIAIAANPLAAEVDPATSCSVVVDGAAAVEVAASAPEKPQRTPKKVLKPRKARPRTKKSG
jgi:recombinational DNA repair protein RecT